MNNKQRMVFINLPVSHLQTAIAYYQALGFDNNPQYTDDTAACMVWSESIYVMLLTHDKWRSFTSRPIPAQNSSEVMLALSCQSRAEVDTMLTRVQKAGGVIDVNPLQDHGFMYSRSLSDPDGHVWELFWMDTIAAQG
ncbi:MAG TPA: lactoylglutathione lyase [Rheinheimera sp.]|uniref:VOC family protein n=1 Tax=Rheinheimera sp. TaxID=1869214 RepID=UPI000ED11F58|nr:VOC family protein [Rheinheimera sp.]HCU67615.1 lactoylglutathione lyase [Rheinheimera sp.]